MNIRELKDRVLFALSVPTCVGCGERLIYGEKSFCHECYAEFCDFKTRNCSRCAKKLNECACSNEYLMAHFIKRVVKCYRYLDGEKANAANSLIYSLKIDNRKDVLTTCADELEVAIRNSVLKPEECIFTNVPRRKAAILKYGIDHSALLANELAKRFNAKYSCLLKSNAKLEQKSLDHSKRLKNADFALKIRADLTNERVIIVDDIITSGASMASAAMLIRSLGCKDITAVTLAIAYKDEK